MVFAHTLPVNGTFFCRARHRILPLMPKESKAVMRVDEPKAKLKVAANNAGWRLNNNIFRVVGNGINFRKFQRKCLGPILRLSPFPADLLKAWSRSSRL